MEKQELHILNLGAGVQSTALYLMFCRGEIQPQIDHAIFADTQEEQQAVYQHLEWLKSLRGPEILILTKGRLGDDLARGVNSTGQRFASIPAYTRGKGDKREGRTRRQCSREYKTEVIEKCIRRELVGLRPRQRMPKDMVVHQYFGISLDEAGRARRIQERTKSLKWATPHFPLIERFMTRANCLTYLADKVPHQTPRSACTFCPYHSDTEWLNVRSNSTDWERAVYIDEQLRVPGNIVNRNMAKPLFVHRSCKPLDEVRFNDKPDPRAAQMAINFWAECEGVCGV